MGITGGESVHQLVGTKSGVPNSLTELWKAQTHLQYSDVSSRPNDALLVSNIDDVEQKTL